MRFGFTHHSVCKKIAILSCSILCVIFVILISKRKTKLRYIYQSPSPVIFPKSISQRDTAVSSIKFKISIGYKQSVPCGMSASNMQPPPNLQLELHQSYNPTHIDDWQHTTPPPLLKYITLCIDSTITQTLTLSIERWKKRTNSRTMSIFSY